MDDPAGPEPEPFQPTWAGEVVGRSASGHVVKIQVAFDHEPDHDNEARVRAEAQAVMRRQYAAWCTSVTYRKFPLG